MMIKPLACFTLMTLPLAACGPTPAQFDPASVQLGANGKTVASANATPAPSREQVAMIPFEGLWGRTPADCDLSNDDRRGTLKIEKGRVDYYAAGGRIDRIVSKTPTSVTLDLRLTGFGRTMLARTTYTLQVAGTRLLRVDASPPKRVQYTRC